MRQFQERIDHFRGLCVACTQKNRVVAQTLKFCFEMSWHIIQIDRNETIFYNRLYFSQNHHYHKGRLKEIPVSTVLDIPSILLFPTLPPIFYCKNRKPMKPADPRTIQNSAQIFELIKKKPYSQFMNGVELTYSILSKKQQDFIFSNDRFLILKGYEYIAYARTLPDNTPLPFRTETDIPSPKSKFTLVDIETFTNEQDKLVIIFAGERNNTGGLFSCQSANSQKTRWEFSCPSKVCALEWRKKLEIAVARAQEFKRSKYEKYSEYGRSKLSADEDKLTNRTEINNLLGFSKISENERSRVEQMPVKTPENVKGQSLPTEKEKVIPIQQNALGDTIKLEKEQLPQQKPKPFESFQPIEKPKQQPLQLIKIEQKQPNEPVQHQRPFTFQLKGPDLAKVQDILLESTNQLPFISKSMSSMSIEGKSKIQSDVSSFRRNWIDELLAGEQQSELFLDFQTYVKKIVEVIVGELHLPEQSKIFPHHQRFRQYIAYQLEDIDLELFLYNEEDIEGKHRRYKQTAREFKNMDYLVEVTQNQGMLKVPFMVLFDYKGFVGMARTKINSDGLYKNREYVEMMNRGQFQEEARINPEILLDQNKCKIVLYEKHTPLQRMNHETQRAYFVQKLINFLPEEDSDTENNLGSTNLLRPELVQDDELETFVFFGRTARGNEQEKMHLLLEQKVAQLLQSLQSHTEYFTNSKQLSQLLHLSGISVRQLGSLYALSTQIWLKRLLQAQIAARCLKNFYRFDMQNCILQTTDRRPREHQDDRQRKRITSFLNLVVGNGEATARLWLSINSYSQQHFGVSFWQQNFSSINTGYFLQALQNHLKIVLNDKVLNKNILFRSEHPLEQTDFIRFELEVTGYNLDFTETFEEINDHLEEEELNEQSFEQLCGVITRTTNGGQTVLELLHSQPIYQKINQFLLNFVSPDHNIELYNKIETAPLPSKFMYESKLAQIKWYLKARRLDHIQKPVKFIQENAAKWLGAVHPIYSQLNRLLAEQYAESEMMHAQAIDYAMSSLHMQLSLFDGEEEPLWKDYFLLGRIHFLSRHYEDALPHLKRAKELVRVERLHNKENYGELLMTLGKCYLSLRHNKDAYATIKDLYQTIREEKDDLSLSMMLESVALIKSLLEMNQQHNSYFNFIESDFGNIMYVFVDNPRSFVTAVKMVAVPYLKHVLLQHNKSQDRLMALLESLSKIKQAPGESLSFLQYKTQEGEFPRNFMKYLKEIDGIIAEIDENQMMVRWISFNNMANQTLLSKIGNSQINRGFELLAYLTALFNLLSGEIIQDMFIMQK